MFFAKEVTPVLPGLSQLAEGMNVDGLLEEIRKHPNHFQSLFVCDPSKKLSSETFLELCIGVFSEEGSNKKLQEIDIFKLFCDFVEYIYHSGNF